MSEVKNITLTIDGQEVQVPPGTNLIHAGQKVGKFIPHFCYNPGLKVVGQCRMCFVDVEGMPKLATACSTFATEGMKVQTESPKVKAAQNSTLEFTLLNHPLDCPICDRGGECKLQDYTYEFGPPTSRMVDEKELKEKHKHVSAEVVLDQERCILCTRCVRFSADVDGRGELVVNERGHHNVIDVFENRPMLSNFSGNVVDLCPVGALTAQDFRFQARPWELKRHDAVCTGCSVGCSIEVHTKHRHFGIARPDGRAPIPQIVRLMPRENLSINEYWMCDKGRWGYHFHNDDAKRIHEPKLRRTKGGELSDVSLKEIQVALDQVTGSWEFWANDSVPHELLAWSKELAQSWTSRGRTVGALNANDFGKEFLTHWASRSSSPWFAGQASWTGIDHVVATVDVRTLETITPILALKLGQRVREGKIKWSVRKSDAMFDSADNLEKTAYLAPSPHQSADITSLAKIPANAKVLVLWTGTNSRGLVNEGLAPTELVAASLAGKSPKGPVFFVNQSTQNSIAPELLAYLSKAPFLVVADSFDSELTKIANVVLPLTPLYETSATLTSVEGIRQLSKGIHIEHPNVPSLKRGDQFISPALRLI